MEEIPGTVRYSVCSQVPGMSPVAPTLHLLYFVILWVLLEQWCGSAVLEGSYPTQGLSVVYSDVIQVPHPLLSHSQE